MQSARRAFIVTSAATLAFVAVYIVLDINAVHALRQSQNTGLYLQMLVNLVHHGSLVNNVDIANKLRFHDSWIVLLLAPAIAIFPRPETLLGVQVVALAIVALVLFALARDCGATPWVASAVAIAYLVAPSIQGYAYDAFGPEQFIPPLAFGLILAARRRAAIAVVVLTLLLLGIKEDIALFLVWFGLATAIWYDRRTGIVIAGLSVVSLALYYALLFEHGLKPWVLPLVFDPSDWPHQLSFLVEILVPTGFAALALGWRALALAVPLVAEVLLVRQPQVMDYRLYRAGDYHTIPLVVGAFAALALVSGARPLIARLALAGSIVMALFFNVTPLHIGRTLVYHVDPQYAAAASWSKTELPVDFPCEDSGAYTVAAADVNARFIECPRGMTRERPTWKDVPLGSSAPWTSGAPTR